MIQIYIVIMDILSKLRGHPVNPVGETQLISVSDRSVASARGNPVNPASAADTSVADTSVADTIADRSVSAEDTSAADTSADISVTSIISSIFDFSSYTIYDALRIFTIGLILSFLGINFFGYLGIVTEAIKDVLKPVLVFLGYGAAETTKSIVNVSAVGTKGLVDVAAGTVVGGVNLLEKGISKKSITMNKIDDENKIDMKLLEKSVQNLNKPEPEPDDAGSRTQSSKMKQKSGFCYIGEDRGFRRCIAVGEGDKCLSGDIFPTDEICVNPNLRE
jgi:hypothetical protein